MKSYFKSKTIWVNFGITLIGGVTAMLQDAPIDPGTLGMILAGLGAVNMFLRSITTEALGSGS